MYYLKIVIITRLKAHSIWERGLCTKSSILDAGRNLHLLCVRQSDAASFCENYAKLCCDAKHLEKGLNWGWLNSWCLFFFFFFSSKKVPFLANIGRCINFLDWTLRCLTEVWIRLSLQENLHSKCFWRPLLALHEVFLKCWRVLQKQIWAWSFAVLGLETNGLIKSNRNSYSYKNSVLYILTIKDYLFYKTNNALLLETCI